MNPTPPAHEELIRLGLAPAAKVARRKRLRKVDATAMAIEMPAIAASVLPPPQVPGAALSAYLESIGKPGVGALQPHRAINASGDCAARWGIAPGTVMLPLTRAAYTRDNTPNEITATHCRNGYEGFIAELGRHDFTAPLQL